MDELLGTLSPEQYWKWCALLCEWQKKDAEYKSEERYYGMMERDIEIARLKSSLFKASLGGKREQVNVKKKDYDVYLAELETKLGFKVAGNLIDDVNYEVRQAPKE